MHGGARGDFVPNGLAGELARGVMRALCDRGQACLAEFRLGNGRRVDVMAIDRSGLLTAVEIKTTAADYRADRKWREYLPYCDGFYFAVPEDFDRAPLPRNVGIMVADRYTAAIMRPSPEYTLNPARRRALVLRFARTAGKRLMRLDRPDYT